VCANHNISQAAFYRWRAKFGGMEVADALRVLQTNADTLAKQLKLPAARQLAESRARALQAFLEAARVERCREPDPV